MCRWASISYPLSSVPPPVRPSVFRSRLPVLCIFQCLRHCTLHHRFYKMIQVKLHHCLCGNLQSNGSLWGIFNWINNRCAVAMMCFQGNITQRIMKLNTKHACLGICIRKWYKANNILWFYSSISINTLLVYMCYWVSSIICILLVGETMIKRLTVKNLHLNIVINRNIVDLKISMA